MGKWTVYDKAGAVRCTVRRLEYNGEFMGSCSVTCTVVSPSPVNWAIGDWLEYRGERFELNTLPSSTKKARVGTSGEAFSYDSVKFDSLADELVRCEFLDIVPGDNMQHYTSLPNFSFYASGVQAIADRVQANLDRLYTGDRKWTVEVHKDFTTDIKGMNIEVDSISVWAGLALVNEKFKANFVVRGRTVTIGTEGIAVDNLFSYGKGNGLFELTRTAEPDQAVITRLHAYGSDKNMPVLYYRKYIDPVIVAPIVKAVYPFNNALLTFPFQLVFEDKGDGVELDITVTAGTKTKDYKLGLFKPDGGQPTGQGLITGISLKDPDDREILKVGAVVRFSKGLDTSGISSEYKKPSGVEYPATLAVNRLMLPGFPKETLDPHIDSKNAAELGIREGSVFFDGSDETLPEIYPSMENMTAERLKKAGVDVVLPEGDNGNLDEILSAQQLDDDGVPGADGKASPGTFTVMLKDVGFALDKVTKDELTLTMKSGMCEGRDFSVSQVLAKDGGYELTLSRELDSALQTFFPYKDSFADYNIKAGDKFILTGLEMPDVYIRVASEKLKEEAEKYLAKNDYVRYSYEPKVSDVFMARNPQLHNILKEGDLMLFEDTDLAVDGSVIIDTLAIKEGDSPVPSYTITLRNEKTTSTLEKIQDKVDSLTGGGAGGGYSADQIRSLIKVYGRKLFLRKDAPDETPYLVKFLGGLHVGEAVSSITAGKGAIIDGRGNAEVESLKVRSFLEVMELVFNRLNAREGDQVFTDNGIVESAVLEEDGTYTLTLHKRWENDFTSFQVGDVVRGIVNNLASGSGEYYTAWMRVLAVDRAANSVSVNVYPDNEVPAGKNFPPVPMMALARWGNAIEHSDGTYNTRQSAWYLSSDEGRIVFHTHVTKPIIEDGNYGLSIGLPPELAALADKAVNYNQPYVYAKGIIVEDLIRLDYQGNVVRTERFRGEWSARTAVTDPYTVTDTTVDVVYHNGCKWQCLVSGTKDEPRYGSTGWVMVEGNKAFTVELDSSNGWAFYPDQLDTVLSVTCSIYNEDVTAHILDKDVAWTRDSGDVTDDNAWAAEHAADGKSLHITVADRGKNYLTTGGVRFTATVLLRDGEGAVAARAEDYVMV